MNNIEFQLIREDLHLSRHDLAEIWGVNPRTVQRWDRGDVPIPKERKKQLNDYYIAVHRAVDNFLAVLKEQSEKHGKPDTVYLLAYDAWTYDGDFPHYKIHNASLMWSKLEAVKRGYLVSIVPFKPEEYKEWLADNGYADNQANRSMWAAEYYAHSFEVSELDEEYLDLDDDDF